MFTKLSPYFLESELLLPCSQNCPHIFWNQNFYYVVHKIVPIFFGIRTLLPCSHSPFICSYLEPNQVSPFPPFGFFKIRLILSSHLLLGLPNDLFPLAIPTKAPYAPLLPSIHATCSTHVILLYLITRKISGELYKPSTSSRALNNQTS